MIRLIFLLAVIFTRCLLVSSLDDDDTDPHWEEFKDQHDKEYASAEEEAEARENFEKNLLHVALHNIQDDDSYDKGLHKYSDMSVEDQLRNLCGTFPSPPNATETIYVDESALEERQSGSSLDWTKQGKVTAVKDQGSCGSCWAFTVVQNVESAVAMKTSRLVTLSEQQVVDCARDASGCNGGDFPKAYNYNFAAGGFVEEQYYPYTAQQGNCREDQVKNRPHYAISSCSQMSPKNEDTLKWALEQNGPISVAIYASSNFMYYSGGIFYDSSYNGQSRNHGVLLTGYGTENGQDYWTIKNSWGTSWGENGYMKLARNRNQHIQISTDFYWSRY